MSPGEPAAEMSANEIVGRSLVAHQPGEPPPSGLPEPRWEVELKIADFGWATDLDDLNNSEMCGTLDYAAPEVLLEQQQVGA